MRVRGDDGDVKIISTCPDCELGGLSHVITSMPSIGFFTDLDSLVQHPPWQPAATFHEVGNRDVDTSVPTNDKKQFISRYQS